jgi:uncharacterized protein YjiS (DUF1127 family)
MTTQTLASYGVAAASPATPGLLGRLVAWLDEQRRYRRTVNELSQLTDRELADVGLTRGEIDTVAKRTTLFGS